MPRVGLEPTIPVFEWTKTFRASDSAATTGGKNTYMKRNFPFQLQNPKFILHPSNPIAGFKFDFHSLFPESNKNCNVPYSF
jgi:hypothetical protein